MSYNPHLGEPNAFIEEHMGLVHKVARQFDNMSGKHGITDDDLVSIGSIGLWKAYRTFDPSLGYKWSTYATNCIKNALTDAFREWRRHRGTLSLDMVLYVDDFGGAVTGADLLFDGIPFDDTTADVAQFMESLTDDQRQMLHMRVHGASREQIAAVMGISIYTVSRKVNAIGRQYLSGDWAARAV